MDQLPMDNLMIGQGGHRQLGRTPTYGIGTPQVTRRSKVVRLDRNKRLIEIQLEDNTMLLMTRTQFERIGGDPVVPNKSILTVVFQRNPSDATKTPSQILMAHCETLPNVNSSMIPTKFPKSI